MLVSLRCARAAILLMSFSGAMAFGAQKSPLEELGFGNPFWQHVVGDSPKVPCTHRVQQHAAGDPVMTPCVHVTKEHPDGDTLPNVPCAHKSLQHPGGHDTGRKGPCIHPEGVGKVKHPGGDPIVSPCDHVITQHPAGDPVAKVPCVHPKAQHPAGDDTGSKVPCGHLAAKHTSGDPGPWLPCAHPVAEVTRTSTGLVFYTADQQLQQTANAATNKLFAQGIRVSRGEGNNPKAKGAAAPGPRGPGSLHIFNHAAYYGDPNDDSDPNWSHYNPVFHSVQVIQTDAEKQNDTLLHEMGHALLGRPCVLIPTTGGSHTLTKESDPSVAMSEGWATFAGLAMKYNQGETPLLDKLYLNDTDKINWELGEKWAADKVPFGPKSEARIVCLLWDLYDTGTESGDSVALTFSELYKVYSPTLATLRDGPIMADVDDYLVRLQHNHPALAAQIQAVRDKNLNKPVAARKTR